MLAFDQDKVLLGDILDFGEYMLCVGFYLIGVFLAYGAILHDRLDSIPQNIAPWEYGGFYINSLLSWAALILLLFSAHNEDRMFDYTFTVPEDRKWRGEDDGW